MDLGWFRWDETTLGWMMERRWRSWSALRVTPLHGAPTFTILCHCTMLRLSTIPTGLNQPAQGCEERATLGTASTMWINAERVESSDAEHAAAAIRATVRSTLSGLADWLGGMDPG